MRTTVEITEDQHRALNAIAHRRHIRGFSALVQEALDVYLADVGPEEVDLLLALEGVLSDDDARQVRSHIAETKATWRAG